MTKQTFSTSIVPHVGSIEQYIQTVNRIPLLTEEEEQEYATRFQKDEDLESARKLVLSHLRVVVTIARGYLGYGLPHADLIQEGNIGLMKAVRRFDPTRKVRLFSFAIHWIKAEIHEYIIKNWRIVKIATTKSQRKLFFNLRSFKAECQTTQYLTTSEIKELATQLNVDQQDVIEMERRLRNPDIGLEASFDDDHSDNDYGNNNSMIKYLPHPDPDPAEYLAKTQTEALHTEKLSYAMSQLDERSRNIIKARWLREDEDCATLHDLAEQYGVSAERIRQIESKAMQKLRSLITVH